MSMMLVWYLPNKEGSVINKQDDSKQTSSKQTTAKQRDSKQNTSQNKLVFFTSQRLLLIVIALLVIFLIWQFVISLNLSGIKDELQSLYDGFRSNNVEIDELRTTAGQLAETGRSLSRILDLPEPEYHLYQEDEENAEPLSPFMLYFSAVDRIVDKRNAEIEALARDDLYKAASFKRLLALFNLSADLSPWESERSIVLRNKQDVEYLRISITAGKSAVLEYGVYDLIGEERVFSGEPDSIVAQITPILDSLQEQYRQYQEQVQQLAALIKEDALRNILIESHISSAIQNEYPTTVVFQKQGYELLRVRVDITDLHFYVASTSFANISQLRLYLINTLQSDAVATPSEEKLRENMQTLEHLFEDPGFLGYLEQRNLKFVMPPREDAEHIFYDIVDADGKQVGSLALQFATGSIWLMDKDGSPISSLDSLIQSTGETIERNPEKGSIQTEGANYDLDRKNSDDALSILLIGAHENMADAIIIAYLIPETKKISLFSVPRDLYYRGKKINNIYAGFGPKLLVQEIENITNLEIDHYIAIDMFAFIDAINALGGLDIVLEEPLIDPTYRVKINGRWSTLYYPLGAHHINGIEALRLARSRGTSSDFDRSARQQKILFALYQKVTNLGILKDSEKLYSLLRILFSYVRSDLSIVEVISYLKQYSDADIGKQIVLDTSNVLYNTYTNLRFLKEDDPVPEYKGLWILLPRGDNWDVIPRFIHSNIRALKNG